MRTYLSKPLPDRHMPGRMITTYTVLNGVIVALMSATLLFWTADGLCTTFDGSAGTNCRVDSGTSFIFNGSTFTISSKQVFVAAGGTNEDSLMLFPNSLDGVVDCSGRNSAANLTRYTLVQTAWNPDYDLNVPGQTCFGGCLTVGFDFGFTVSAGVAIVRCSSQSVLAKPPSITAKWTAPMTGGLEFVQWPARSVYVTSITMTNSTGHTTTHYLPNSEELVGSPGVIYGSDGKLYAWDGNLPQGVTVWAFFSLTAAPFVNEMGLMTQINVSNSVATTSLRLATDTTSCPYTTAPIQALSSGAFDNNPSYVDFNYDDAAAQLNSVSGLEAETQGLIQSYCAIANQASYAEEGTMSAWYLKSQNSQSIYAAPQATGIPGISNYVCSSISQTPYANCEGQFTTYSGPPEETSQIDDYANGPIIAQCRSSTATVVEFDFSGALPGTQAPSGLKPNCTLYSLEGWNCSDCVSVAQCAGGSSKLWVNPQGLPSYISTSGAFVPNIPANTCSGTVTIMSNDTVFIRTNEAQCDIVGCTGCTTGVNTFRFNGTVVIMLSNAIYEFGVIHIPKNYSNRNLTIDPRHSVVPGAPPSHQDCSWYDLACGWDSDAHTKSIMIVVLVIIGLTVFGCLVYGACCGRRKVYVSKRDPYP